MRYGNFRLRFSFSGRASGREPDVGGEPRRPDGRARLVRLIARLAQQLVGVVVAVHDLSRAVREHDQQIDDAVEEVAVVADDDRRALELLQRLFQRVAGPEVEVVGRLVEDQHVGAVDGELRERRPAPLAAGELLHRLLDDLAVQAEAAEQVAHLLLGVRRVVVRPDGAHHAASRGRAVPGAGRVAGNTRWPRWTLPDVGSSSPSRIASSVVLPLPLGPMMPRRLPRGRSKLRFSNRASVAVALRQVLDVEDDVAGARRPRRSACAARRPSSASRSRSSLSSALTRDCACLASCP